MLPKSLMVAIAALRDNTCFRAAFGEPFIDYFIKLKEFEIGRFLSEVTDWEQREYFAIL
jgi:glutamine synthetase